MVRVAYQFTARGEQSDFSILTLNLSSLCSWEPHFSKTQDSKSLGRGRHWRWLKGSGKVEGVEASWSTFILTWGSRGRERRRVWVHWDSVLRTSTSASRLLNLASDLARADLFVRFLSAASDFRPSQEAARKASVIETFNLGQEVESKTKMWN